MRAEKTVDKNSGVIDYIQIIEALKRDDKIIVYRGETRDYGDTACQPNIFRGGYLYTNEKIEKNIIDEMTANHLVQGDSYLEKAINAQHGGFPSRLLDVSYSSLVALFFATTPFYNKGISSSDDRDGYVYVFSLSEMFCPSGNGIQENYEALISDKYKWFSKTTLFNRNFKLIDHIKTNPRIIAQQGAFILFQGLDARKIPENMYVKIKVEKEAKARIRKQLKDLFNIHMGTIYPEGNNLVEEIINKSKVANNMSFCLENELMMTMRALKNDIDWLLRRFLSNPEEYVIKDFERIVFWYKKGILQLENGADSEERELISRFINDYNLCVDKAITKFRRIKRNVFVNIDEIKINGGMQK